MLLNNRRAYYKFLAEVNGDCTEDQKAGIMREMCMSDLYFLLVYGCGRMDADKDWLFDRCREVQANPDDMLDLWAREHYKSTVITFALTIQEILNNPEITIGIFSHTRPNAKGFLRQIKREFELNGNLKNWFQDVLYDNPAKQAIKWSEDDGIIVKRESNPKESTVEAWGVVDGQPTGKHFSLLVYDDIVTKESVTTPEMIEKTTDALALSFNLGAHGGRRRFIGTRYHFADTYKTIMDRGTVTPRIYPATHDGSLTGNPVFLTPEQNNNKRRDMGIYVYSCFVADTDILMADWTEKKICDVEAGDEVVGYSFPAGKGNKTRLVRSNVLAKASREAEVVRFTFASGRTIIATSDHKFFSGRRGKDVGGTDSHLAYVPLGFDKKSLKSAISIYDPRKINGEHDELAVAWLSGIFDGEGSLSGDTIHIHQSHEHNPSVCERIEQVLTKLGFDYGVNVREGSTRNGAKHKASTLYYIRGGRQEKIRFLNICKPVRGYKIVDTLYKHSSRDIGQSQKDKLVSIEPMGVQTVYNIQTETVNYVANGYAVKNCQMLQNPVADSSQGFDRGWMQYFDGKAPNECVWYLLVDAANGKRKSNDFTSIWAVGLGSDNNYYCIPEVRDRLNLTERANRLIELHRKYRPIEVRYERYGMMADISFIMVKQEQIGYRFPIIEVAGPTSKIDRIKRLVPLFEDSKIYLPRTYIVTDYEGKSRDLVHDFIEEECVPFPVPLHDDMLDALARITEQEGMKHGADKKIDLKLQWPQKKKYRTPIIQPYAPSVSGMGY